MREVDIAIIGAGTAGLTAYGAASKYTDRLALIDQGPWGTTCARVGCMPSKLLIAAAENVAAIRRSEIFGIESTEPHIQSDKVMARLRRERDRFVNSVLETLDQMPAEHKVQGRARFVGPHQLVVGDSLEIKAKAIVLATGARPNVPVFLHKAGDRLLVNDTLFELPRLPKRIAVFGPGVLGIEIGQALARLGVEIRMFGIDGSLAGLADEDVRHYAQKCFNEEFYLDTNANVKAVEGDDSSVSVTFDHPEKGELTEQFDYVLASTGRAPNLDSLALENSGLELDEDGSPQFDTSTLQCGDSHIFIAGDVNGHLPVLHEAASEGRTAGKNAASYPNVRQERRTTPFSVVFTSPQIALVGTQVGALGEEQRKKFVSARFCFENQGRSRVMATDKGLLKLYAQRDSALFAGAEIFCPEAEHIGHLLAWALENRMSVEAMLAMPFYHPVVEEGIRTALSTLNHTLKRRSHSQDGCLECGPGG